MRHFAVLDAVSSARRPLVRGLVSAIAVLAMLHVIALATRPLWRTESETVRSIVGAWFDLDSEVGFGTWFAVVQLALAATIAALIALRERSHGGRWRGWAFIAVVLTAMSIDEQIVAHERLGRVGAALGLTINGVNPWFLPAAIVLVVVGLMLLPVAVGLPRRTRRGLLVASLVYVVGALGFELLSWSYVLLIVQDPAAALSPVVGVLQLFEEGLELLGVALAIATMLDHARSTALSTTGPPSTTA